MYDFDPSDPLGTKESWPHTSDGPEEKEKVIMHMRNIGKAPKRHKTADALTEFIEENVHYSDSKVGVILLGVFQDKKSANYEAFKEAKFGRPYPKFCVGQGCHACGRVHQRRKGCFSGSNKERRCICCELVVPTFSVRFIFAPSTCVLILCSSLKFSSGVKVHRRS
jgi:hypothetical protein